MRALTNEALEQLRANLESDCVERKESLKRDAPNKVREAICAFANDLAGRGGPGGVFIGLRDDGLPVPNFVVTDELLVQLSSMKTDGNTSQLPSLLVEKRQAGGGERAVIRVWSCDTPPLRYRGLVPRTNIF